MPFGEYMYAFPLDKIPRSGISGPYAKYVQLYRILTVLQSYQTDLESQQQCRRVPVVSVSNN